jgi:hypothetical protein
MKARVVCQDKYEAQKLSSLLFNKESKEMFMTKILDVFDTEIIVSLKDKSAHSIVFHNNDNVEIFVDFIQSVFEDLHKITNVTIIEENTIEIIKE